MLATKCGNHRSPEGVFLRINGTPKSLRTACQDSLRRLNTDRIDLYYSHQVHPTVPMERTIGATDALVAEGTGRYIRLSEASLNPIRRAHHIHPITALQTEYSL